MSDKPLSKAKVTIERELARDESANDFSHIGVFATAVVATPNGSGWILTRIRSPGLWGIEEDSSEDYLSEVYEEEKATLLRILASLRDYELVQTD
jgi:hypothetical protein